MIWNDEIFMRNHVVVSLIFRSKQTPPRMYIMGPRGLRIMFLSLTIISSISLFTINFGTEDLNLVEPHSSCPNLICPTEIS